ncbi:hypothetical protein D3C87_131900 [compost metagenome]
MHISNRLKPLTSLPFLICLALLMLNDFYLKEAFHNTFTGKLSDFCGLFIFSIFWSAFLPKRKLAIFILTGLLFIYWKSSYSSTFIEFFSTYIFPIQRVVDPTDLLALIVLPLAWYSLNSFTFSINFYPQFIAALAFFAFCASSAPRYIQSFDQPQYVLFKSNVLPDSNYYEEDFTFHRFDSLLVVEVKQLVTTRRPVKSDDYTKNLLLISLDESLHNQMPEIVKPMTLGKITYLRLKTPNYEDSLRFKGSRLDGKFIRKNADTTLIEGYYKNGIEDSIWTYREPTNTIVTKKTFIKGENTQIQKFEGDRMISSDRINTRADTITRKYIQLAVLTMLVILVIVLIVKNYRATYPEAVQMKWGWKYFLCFLLPISVWLAQMGITVFITDPYSTSLDFIFNFIIIYIITLPLFIIITSWIKWRKKVDLLWYCLLFALMYTVFLECQMLVALSAIV